MARTAYDVTVRLSFECPESGRDVIGREVGPESLFLVEEACGRDPRAVASVWASVRCPHCGHDHGVKLLAEA